MKSLFDWQSCDNTCPPTFSLSRCCMNHQFICVTFVPEMAGWVVLLDLWNHYCTLGISTWSLSQDYKIYTSPSWQLTLYGWMDWRLCKKYVHHQWFAYATAYLMMMTSVSVGCSQGENRGTVKWTWKSSFLMFSFPINLDAIHEVDIFSWLSLPYLPFFRTVLWTSAGHELDCDHNNLSSASNPFLCTYPCFPCTLTFYVIVRPHCNCCKWRHKGCTDGY